MNQPPNIDLSEEAIAIIVREASRAGKSPNDWLMSILRIVPSFRPNVCFEEQESSHTELSAEDKRIADRNRLEQFIGAISMPEAIGADNDQIDADIAASIDDTHEHS